MRAAGWVAVGGGVAAVAGAGLLFLGFRQSSACMVKMQEEGSQDPFACVSAGAPFLIGGAVIGGAGVLTAIVSGAVALIQR